MSTERRRERRGKVWAPMWGMAAETRKGEREIVCDVTGANEQQHRVGVEAEEGTPMEGTR